VIREATGQLHDAIPGADVWHWSGQSLANLATAQEITITPDPDVLTAAVEVEHDSETNFRDTTTSRFPGRGEIA